MIEYVIGGLAFIIGLFGWLLHGATNNRMKDRDEELENWSGVYDVKREADNRLANDAERRRLREKYNNDA